MKEVTICGINGGIAIPFKVTNGGALQTATTYSNNKEVGKADLTALLLGQYKSQSLPVLVDSEGKIIV